MWNFHVTDLLHAFFTGLLLFQQLALTADVAAVAFGQYVLSERLEREYDLDLITTAPTVIFELLLNCLLYTSDAADE